MKGLALLSCVVLIGLVVTDRLNARNQPGIAPETVTDYIHAVIEADRTFYTIHVVERQEQNGGAPAAENWRSKKNILPLPAQFLLEAGNLAATTGSKVRYRLISQWPINPQNGPQGRLEANGLSAVREHPERSVTGTVTIDNRLYFQAVYADRAVSRSCVECHNAHPNSQKKDFKIDDVMDGLVIEIPLDN
ncbi:hypothetical protein W02_26360 [Nitrospira sp. KM1]|uniref:Tll0287-like domain-containing protein n=1 Tax=Nitrospira sp. KM1 TaxID=1936990 RepID=UPI0013A7525C|nr:DUF3365 domain-containing protein [Nitrospira sp. KM1]BCA55496.1 hypothetical protein W02_26360 [Nitrospira sp. KM1]